MLSPPNSGSNLASTPAGDALTPAPTTSPPSPGGGCPDTISSLVSLGCDADSARVLVRYLDENTGSQQQWQAMRGWMHCRMSDNQITRWLQRYGYWPSAA